MRRYQVTPLHRGTDGWTVLRSIPREEDEPLGHYLERDEAQSECDRLVSEEAERQGRSE
jgi:hypothetical protein